MPIIPSGVGYSNGTVYQPNGTVFLDFDPRINPDLHGLFSNIGQLVGLNADISGLPDSLVIDGITYNINYLEDVKQELVDLIDAWEVEFGWSEAKVKRVLRPLIVLLRALHREGWF